MRRIVGIWLLLLAGRYTLAQEPDVLVNGEIGFKTRYRIGAFAPLRVNLRNLGESRTLLVEARLRTSQGGQDVHRATVNLPAGTSKTIEFVILVGRDQPLSDDIPGEVKIPLVVTDDRSRVVYQGGLRGRPVTRGRFLLQFADRSDAGFSPLSSDTAQRLGHPDLPEDPVALEGVDLIYVTSPQMLFAERPSIGETLLAWVRGGGTLVIRASPVFLQPPPPALRDVTPDLAGDEPVASDGDLESRIPGLSAIPPPTRMTHRMGPDSVGHALLRDAHGALAQQVRIGTGRLVFLTFDPADASILSPSLQQAFWNGLLSEAFQNAGPAKELAPYSNWENAFADGACEPVELRTVGFTGFFIVLFIFALIAGPGVTLALGKRRAPLIWLIVPALSAGLSAGIYLLALRDRPGTAQAHRITFVDMDASGEPGPYSQVIGLFSTSSGDYELALSGHDTSAGSLAAPADMTRYRRGSAADMLMGQLRTVAKEDRFRVDMNPYSARSFRAAGWLAPEGRKKLGQGLSLVSATEVGLILRNDTHVALSFGWVVGSEQEGDFEDLEPGEQTEIVLGSPRDPGDPYDDQRIRLYSWRDGARLRNFDGILTATLHHRRFEAWCPFDLHPPRDETAFLVVALAKADLAPVEIRGRDFESLELSVIRTVVRIVK